MMFVLCCADGRILPINRRQNVHPNGTLIVEAVERTSDQGRYTCVARNTQGYTARGDLDVQVMGEYTSFVLSSTHTFTILTTVREFSDRGKRKYTSHSIIIVQ